jgi:hypothetical protein
MAPAKSSSGFSTAPIHQSRTAGNERARSQTCLNVGAREQEAVDSSVPRTSANHVTAETDRKQLEKAAPVGDRRRCESRPGADMANGVSGDWLGWPSRCDTGASSLAPAPSCTFRMISALLLIMPLPIPPMTGARSHHRAVSHAPSSQPYQLLPRVHICRAIAQTKVWIVRHAQGCRPVINASPASRSVPRESPTAPERGHVIL